MRTRRQGRTDFAMSLAAALGAIAAGGALGWVGFGGLALLTLPVIAVVLVLAPLGGADRVRPRSVAVPRQY